ncbi:MAG: DUF4864 domain-containing protein [Pseudomonadota bacterium]
MKPLVVAIAAIVLTLGSLTGASAQESELSAGDREQIQSVIDRQIDAFRRDDGPAAYEFAAPSIKRIFPSVTRFMSMVQQGYAPVYRPQTYTFDDLRMTDRGPVQAVRIVGPNNGSWVALYTFQQQPDGTWKISGVYLQRAPGTTT